MSDILHIEGLSAGYGALGVLHSVDLTVRAGERIGIVGLNGHGKSTLLRAVAGLTGWQSGSIKLNGVEIGGARSQGPGRYTHKIVRMGLSLMPEGDALFHGLSVADHLDSGAYTKRAWRERKQRREYVLGIFPPLQKLLDQPVGKLSGGERRMVSLGRGLMADAKLLLIDEPSLGLAPKIVDIVFDALAEIRRRGVTVLLVEQRAQRTVAFADRTYLLSNGEIRLSLTPDDAGDTEKMVAAYLS
jgi:branched-chain amino acid transport system ATP-binding protein